MLGPAHNRGLSIIELLIVLALVGILAGIGVTQLNSAGVATSQAAQVVASAINRARFEAVRTNNTAGFEVIAADAAQSGTIRICRNINETQALSCATGTIVQSIVLSEGDLGRARIASPATLAVFFDRRGVVRNPAGQVVTITDRVGGNIRTVTILPTGRVEVR
ncbi:MAG: GspH/FimT family pseudopilin [Truepera sp.]|nr:GspH/FimT family pseudopilin [Truepera sp.]